MSPAPASADNSARETRITWLLLSGMVFLGACLLFGMEPLVGRVLTPRYGGAASVWLTCLMFFQGSLFFGYLYAHFLAPRLGAWHLLVLAIPVLLLPLELPASSVAAESGTLELLGALSRGVFAPFAALSTSAVVAQLWLARSSKAGDLQPYPLYAASNAGSLLALIAYPFLIEPLLGLQSQRTLWSAAYLAYLALVAVTWLRVRPRPDQGRKVAHHDAHAERDTKPHLRTYLLWLLLSSLPSAFLLALTNVLTNEVGSFPLVWVLPLSLYLGSFIVSFRGGGSGSALLAKPWLEASLLGLLLFLLPGLGLLALLGQLAVLFVLCLAVHSALYAYRPPARYLTHFYVFIALGGWLGGAAVSLAAPMRLDSLAEYPISLASIAACLLWLRRQSLVQLWRRASVPAAAGRLMVLAALLLPLAYAIKAVLQTEPVGRHRNFYGVYTIVDEPPSRAAPGGMRRLLHGRTQHGNQLLDPTQRRRTIAYYHPDGDIAAVLKALPTPRQVAVIGLGAGVAAALTEPADRITYFEIDPDAEAIARRYFSYLDDAAPRVQVLDGDGRLAFAALASDQSYGLIFVDAFSGDGIPSHLLTTEAIELYLGRLQANGLLLFHVSNRFYELRPVLKAAATALGLEGAFNLPKREQALADLERPTSCVVMARSAAPLAPLLRQGWRALGPDDGMARMSPWSDDYVNIVAPLFRKVWLRLAGDGYGDLTRTPAQQ